MPELPSALLEQAILDRRDLHTFPETGWTEFRTTAKVIQRLQSLGFDVSWGKDVLADGARLGVPAEAELDAAFERALSEGGPEDLLGPMRGGYTGCCAEIEGSGDGPTVVLRFDIDALEVAESQADHRPAVEGFVSRHPGQMHACGHDAHTAMGLGVAAVLAAARSRFPGKVRLLFQPAEEGTRGAQAMVEAGLVDDADYFLCPHIGAQSHVSGEILPGITGFLATRKLDVRFRGREAHAGLAPQDGANAVVAAALATLSLHAISRHSDGNSRVNVGVLQAGSGRNVVGGRGLCKVELRGESTEIVDYLEEEARRAVEGAAMSQGVEVDVTVAGSAPSAGSDQEVMDAVAHAATQAQSVRRVGEPCGAGASDDATVMMARVQQRGGKAAYMIVGSDLPSGHHTPRFDVDEQVFANGIATLSGAALALLGGETA